MGGSHGFGLHLGWGLQAKGRSVSLAGPWDKFYLGLHNLSHEYLPPGTEQGRGRQKDSGRSTTMAKVTQSGQEDQAPMPRLALSSTPPNQLPVRLSTCGLRIPQRLCVRWRGAGLRVGGRAFRKLRTDGHGQGPCP